MPINAARRSIASRRSFAEAQDDRKISFAGARADRTRSFAGTQDDNKRSADAWDDRERVILKAFFVILNEGCRSEGSARSDFCVNRYLLEPSPRRRLERGSAIDLRAPLGVPVPQWNLREPFPPLAMLAAAPPKFVRLANRGSFMTGLVLPAPYRAKDVDLDRCANLRDSEVKSTERSI